MDAAWRLLIAWNSCCACITRTNRSAPAPMCRSRYRTEHCQHSAENIEKELQTFNHAVTPTRVPSLRKHDHCKGDCLWALEFWGLRFGGC